MRDRRVARDGPGGRRLRIDQRVRSLAAAVRGHPLREEVVAGVPAVHPREQVFSGAVAQAGRPLIVPRGVVIQLRIESSARAVGEDRDRVDVRRSVAGVLPGRKERVAAVPHGARSSLPSRGAGIDAEVRSRRRGVVGHPRAPHVRVQPQAVALILPEEVRAVGTGRSPNVLLIPAQPVVIHLHVPADRRARGAEPLGKDVPGIDGGAQVPVDPGDHESPGWIGDHGRGSGLLRGEGVDQEVRPDHGSRGVDPLSVDIEGSG